MARRQSISTRFNVALVIIVAALMAVFSLVAASVTTQRILLELDAKLSNYLQLSSTALEAPLWNFDNRTVEDFIESLMLDPTFVLVRVVSGDGSIIERTQPGLSHDASSSTETRASRSCKNAARTFGCRSASKRPAMAGRFRSSVTYPT